MFSNVENVLKPIRNTEKCYILQVPHSGAKNIEILIRYKALRNHNDRNNSAVEVSILRKNIRDSTTPTCEALNK